MKTIDQKQQKTIQAADDAAQAGKAGVIITVMAAGSIGAWGSACMIAALSTNGIGGMIKGFMTAVTGM